VIQTYFFPLFEIYSFWQNVCAEKSTLYYITFAKEQGSRLPAEKAEIAQCEAGSEDEGPFKEVVFPEKTN